jgi:hypothetical protein
LSYVLKTNSKEEKRAPGGIPKIIGVETADAKW